MTVAAGATSARSTRPTRNSPVARPRCVLISVPTLNNAHPLRNTIDAPFRLARELRRCALDSVAHSDWDSSSNNGMSRDNGRPRLAKSWSCAEIIGDVGMCNEGFTRLMGDMTGREWLRPKLPPRPLRSLLQDTLRVLRPPSEWKLSARRARASSSTSSSSSSASACDSLESTLWWTRQRLCSSCWAARAAAAATLAATFDNAR